VVRNGDRSIFPTRRRAGCGGKIDLSPFLLLLLVGCSGGDSGGGVVPPPSAVTLLQVQTQVFTPRCAISGCHVEPGAPFALDLSSVADSGANLVGVPSAEIPGLLRVAPFDPDNSYVYWKLTANPGIFGDPMPASGGPLSPSDLALVTAWIEDGAM
jgi:hypothetical protein